MNPMFKQTVTQKTNNITLPTKFLFSPGYETSVMKIHNELITKTVVSFNSSNIF